MSYPIKQYTKKELGLMYFPDSTPETARHHLMNWIKRNCSLLDALQKAGYNAYAHDFSPRQIRLIFEYLGEPG